MAEYPRWYDPLRLISAALYKYNFHWESLLIKGGLSLSHFGGKLTLNGEQSEKTHFERGTKWGAYDS